VPFECQSEGAAAARSGPGRYRVDDRLQLPDEPHCELLDGRLRTTTVPSAMRDQRVMMRLAGALLPRAGAAGAERHAHC
jgi:hypothetical protein